MTVKICDMQLAYFCLICNPKLSYILFSFSCLPLNVFVGGERELVELD